MIELAPTRSGSRWYFEVFPGFTECSSCVAMPGGQGVVDRFKSPGMERIFRSALVLIVQPDPENAFVLTLELLVPRPPPGGVHEVFDGG